MYSVRLPKLSLLTILAAVVALLVIGGFMLSNASDWEPQSWGPWNTMAQKLRLRTPSIVELFDVDPPESADGVVFSRDFTATKTTSRTCASFCEVSLISKQPVDAVFTLTVAQNDRVIWLLLVSSRKLAATIPISPSPAIGLLPHKIVNAHYDVLATHYLPGDTIMFERTREHNGSNSACAWSAQHQPHNMTTKTLLQKWPCGRFASTMYAVVKLYQPGTSVDIHVDDDNSAVFCAKHADCNKNTKKAQCDAARRRCVACSADIQCGDKFDTAQTTCDVASGTCVVPREAVFFSYDRLGVEIFPMMFIINADHGVAILILSLLHLRPIPTPIKLVVSGAPSTHYALRCEETNNTMSDCFDAPTNTLIIPAHHKQCALRITGTIGAPAVGFVALTVVVATVANIELLPGMSASATVILTDLPHRACTADTDCLDNMPCHPVSKVCLYAATGATTGPLTQLQPTRQPEPPAVNIAKEPDLRILYSEADWEYYKIPIRRNREKISSTIVFRTCVDANMSAMCSAGPPCVYYSHACIVTPLSTNCRNPAGPLSKKMCGPGPMAKCTRLNKVFAFLGASENSSACGIIDGTACVRSVDYASDGEYFALCAIKRPIAIAFLPPRTTAKSQPTVTAVNPPTAILVSTSLVKPQRAPIDCKRFPLGHNCAACGGQADKACTARDGAPGACSSDGKTKCSRTIDCGGHTATSCLLCGKTLGDVGCHGKCELVEEMKGTRHNPCMKKLNHPLCSYYPLKWAESDVNEKGVLIESLSLELMNATHYIMAGLHIEYSICRGTAIGLARHGYFIPWDDDVDICIKTANENRRITASLRSDKRWCTTPFWGGVKIFACGARYNYPFIDIFDVFRNDFIFPPVQVSFGPLLLMAPRDIQAYLVDQYGSNVTKECESPHFDHKLSRDLHQPDDMRTVLCNLLFEKCGEQYPVRFQLI
eukprot:GEMP01008823.1.p1 GENE.GEMP01008823.1~~GEMP01008823.1.p1  ORF type:complete len:941 (+),score=179.24 GEMP01008823.1:232-3054(+)